MTGLGGLLLVILWFAASAGIQFLQPQSIELAWWPGQILVPLLQVTGLALAVHRWRKRSGLALWLAALAAWSWPWLGQPQWLRVTPTEVVWFLALLAWVGEVSEGVPPSENTGVGEVSEGGAPPQQGSSIRWGSALLLALACPASAAAVVAAEAVNWPMVLLAALLWPWKFAVPGWEHGLWAGLALGLVWFCPHWRRLGLFTLVSASKGAPTSSLVLAAAVLEGVSVWRWSPWGLGLLGTWLLGQSGETQLNRQLIVPWQKQGVPLWQGLIPHGRDWWVEHLGPYWGFSQEDLECARRLKGPTLVWDTPTIRRLYWEFSGGQSLLDPDPVAAAQVLRTQSLVGTGLQAVVLGRPHPRVVSQPSGGLSCSPAPGTLVLNPDDSVLVSAEQPLVLQGPGLPQLVLQPGRNPLFLPLRSSVRRYACGSLHLTLPQRNWDEQCGALSLHIASQRVPAQSLVPLAFRLVNHGRETCNLEALAGIRGRFAGCPWQPLQPLAGRISAGQALGGELRIQTQAPLGRREFEVVWEEPDGRRQQAARVWLDLWAEQHPEQYLNLSP